MNKNPHLAYTSIVPEIKGNSSIRRVIILLHGYGSNMKDLASLSEYIEDDGNLYVSINAPIKLVDFGAQSFAWFEIGPIEDMEQRKYSVQKSTDLILNTINHIINVFNTDSTPIVLAGFSQGGMMAMNIALTSDQKFDGVAALSSRLITNPSNKINNLNFFISHGTKDNVIDISEGHNTRDLLEKYGHNVKYKEYDMGHEISADCLTDFTIWLKSIN